MPCRGFHARGRRGPAHRDCLHPVKQFGR
jgi:hypothetical protein